MSIPFVPSPHQVMGMQHPQDFHSHPELNSDLINPSTGMFKQDQMHPNKIQQQNNFTGRSVHSVNNSSPSVPPTQQMTNQFGQMTIASSNSAKRPPLNDPNQMTFSPIANGSNEPLTLGRDNPYQSPMNQRSSNFTRLSQQYVNPVVQPSPITGSMNSYSPLTTSCSKENLAPGFTTSPPMASSSAPPTLIPNHVQTTFTTGSPLVSPVQNSDQGYHAPNPYQSSFPPTRDTFNLQSTNLSAPGIVPNFPSSNTLGPIAQQMTLQSETGAFMGNMNRPPAPGSQYSNTAQPVPLQQQLPPGTYRPAYPGAMPSSIGQQPFPPGMVQRQHYPPNVPPERMQAPRGPPLSDMMPNPITTREEDQIRNGGPFCTNTRGQLPPLATTEFIVQDGGICSPRFLCSTLYSIPCQPDLLKQSYLPFAVAMNPFADVHSGEEVPPISNMQGSGPVRCKRCKAYMCPFMKFIDGGRRFQCAFCDGNTDVSEGYFSFLDNMGQRSDKFQRPELCLGSYEFIGTSEYCKNDVLPNPPAFIFMIDVSYNSVKSGFVNLLCQNIKDILKDLPRETDSDVSTIRVGFVTYNDTVHFYNIKGQLSQPQMLMVSDINDMFVPLIEGFLILPHEAEAVIESLMEQIPIMFSETKQTEVVLGPIIQAGLDALKSADCCGKLFIFHSSLPSCEAPGKLVNREDRALLGTEKEKIVLGPQVPFYTTVGEQCVAAGCSVDLFLFPNAYVDIATIGEVCRLTGGQIYKYSYFQASIDGERFLEDLRSDIKQSSIFDAVMRVRTSSGIRATDFYGNYYMANTTDLELATLDSTKNITAEIKYDDKLPVGEGAFIQVATLYTSCSGQRRIRIHNLALNTCTSLQELFQSCLLDSIVDFFAKRALKLLLVQTPKQIKDGIVSALSNILATYKKADSSSSSSSQLILPINLTLLPLYVNCVLKSDAIFGGSDMTSDDRSFAMLTVNSMPIIETIRYLYPCLISLHDIDVNSVGFPSTIRCSMANIKDNGVYLLENGLFMFMWIGQSVALNWIQDVFGVATIADIEENVILPDMTTLLSKKIRSTIEDIRKETKRHLRLFIVKQGGKLDIVFRQFLVEDQSNRAAPSYVEFLCQLQQEICKLIK